MNSIEVVGHQKHLLEEALPSEAHGGFLLFIKLGLDLSDLRDNDWVVDREVADACQVDNGVLILTALHKKTRRLVVEEGEDEDDAGEHDVEGGRDDPARVGLVGNVDGGSPASKVCQHDTEVDGSGEGGCAETTDRLWRDLREVYGGNDRGLTDTQAGNEAAGVDLTEATVVGQKDDDTDDPDETQLTGCPETSDAIAKNESAVVSISHCAVVGRGGRNLQSSAGDTANLHHGGDVGLNVGVFFLGDLVGITDSQVVSEMLGAEGAADETFVNTSGGSHQTEGEDGQP